MPRNHSEALYQTAAIAKEVCSLQPATHCRSDNFAALLARTAAVPLVVNGTIVPDGLDLSQTDEESIALWLMEHQCIAVIRSGDWNWKVL